MSSSEKSASANPATKGKQVARRASEYMVVARRYRPQNFDELVGQEQSSQALRNAITTNRVGHAYLFTGARGVGKTSTARIFAKALNCVTGPTTHACSQCDICRGIATGEDVDVLEIDGASNRGIDEIRQLRSTVNVRPSRARFKIYIIDEVHMLTAAAFNALLKTLEEPPEHVKFIFCTTDPEEIPITVLSRCQRYDFPPVETSSILARLREIVSAEGVSAEDEALQILARRANGSLRDSQSLLEQLLSFSGDTIRLADVHRLLGTAPTTRLRHLCGQLLRRNIAESLRSIEVAMSDGVDPGQLCEQLLGYYRDLMVVASGGTVEMMLNTSASEFAEIKTTSSQLGLETILATMQILDHTLTRVRQSTHVRMLLEIALVRICSLENLSQLSALIASLSSGQLPAPIVSPTNLPAPSLPAPSSAATSSPASSSPNAGSQAASSPASESLPATSTAHPVQADQKKKDELSPNQTSVQDRTSEIGGQASCTQLPATGAANRVVTEAANRAATEEFRSTASELSVPEPTSSQLRPTSPSNVVDAPTVVATPKPVTPPTIGASNFVQDGVTSHSEKSAVEPEANEVRPTSDEAARVWSNVLASLGDMTTSAGQMAMRVDFESAHRLSVVFPVSCSLQKEICERRKSRLEEAIAIAVGRTIRLDLTLSADDVPVSEKPMPAVSTRQLVREVQKSPFVARALELFDGEVLRVEERRGTSPNESTKG